MAGSISQGISSLLNQNTTEPYTARASIKDGVVDGTTSSVTGKRTGGLFVDNSKDMNKDDFLLLLTTQLRFQDPLSPMDNTEFVSQLAQFRSLEGTNNMEKTLRELKDSFQGTVEAQKYSANSITNAAAVSLIGKEVRLRETQASFHGVAGSSIPIRVHLGNAVSAEVRLLGEDGSVIKTFKATGKDAENSVTLLWDGSTDAGQFVKAGSYEIQIVGQETDPALYAFVEDVVEGVRFSSNGALMKVGGKELSIGSILDVSGGEQSTEFEALSPASAIALLGKQVRLQRDSVVLGATRSETAEIRINIGQLPRATVRLYDASGKEVRILNAAADGDGTATAVWDGLLMDGATTAEPGTYTIRIDEAARNPSVYSFTEGIVDGVNLAGGVPQIRMNGQTVSVSRIIDIATVSANQEDVA